MSTMSIPILPESAPFPPDQRAWLNGFFAGLLSRSEATGAPGSYGSPAAEAEVAAGAEAEEEFPWHDPTLPMCERQELAKDKKPERKLMAAMAQLDCGSCGYLCKTYAEAIATGADKSLTKCSPGGTETAKKLKELYVELNIAAGANGSVKASAPAAGSANGQVTRDHPWPAPLIASRRLNGPESEKEVRHIEISLKGSAIQYKVGDALGIWPENCEQTISEIIDHLHYSGAEECHTIDGTDTSLFDALLRERVVTTPTESLIELLVGCATQADEASYLQSMLTVESGASLAGLDVLDVLRLAPSARPKAADLVESLGSLQPRLYSISSSPAAHVNQVHLTVGAVRYKGKQGRTLRGVASTYLADRVRPGEKIRVFSQESRHFGLPADAQVPIIMVGPGTGIAPFRAFLHERRATGCRGKNWLFFGDQRKNCDFLYAQEMDDLSRDGILTRLDTAFSRDQSQKVYVQHRMEENGAELWKWLDQGAHFYVCGDAKRMAADVDSALRKIVSAHGGMNAENATAYVAKLSKDGRYQRDVY